ncbi:hypothetical protein FM106_16690 [Brachybacterium faecium]|nr:hypothetical protein FM106_16690 [Brachybacterium faecium]
MCLHCIPSEDIIVIFSILQLFRLRKTPYNFQVIFLFTR